MENSNISNQGSFPVPPDMQPLFFIPQMPPIPQINQSSQLSSDSRPSSQEEWTSQMNPTSEQQHKVRKNKSKKDKKRNHNQTKGAHTKSHNGYYDRGDQDPLSYWDCTDDLKHVPPVVGIKKIHIYDFDNTLFHSPCPNPNLLNDQTIGTLTNSDMLHFGGWWAEPLILKNMGQGWDAEKKCTWDKYWNEDVKDLLKLSYSEKDTLAIIMTGRKANMFTHLIESILKARGVNYDGLMLKKGEFDTTISYKTQVLTDLLDYYEDVEQVTIYDDRPAQLNGFQKCLNEYIEAVRPDMTYNLVPVAPNPKYLDPKTERKLIEEIIELHNQQVEIGNSHARLGKVQLKRSFFYSAYLVEPESKVEVIEFLLKKYPDVFTPELQDLLKIQSDFIPISRNKVSKALETELSKDDGIEWELTEFGNLNNQFFAVRVKPVDDRIKTITLFEPPFLSFATTNKTLVGVEEPEKITDWEPIEDPIKIKTQFGQVVKFKIVQEQESRKRKRH